MSQAVAVPPSPVAIEAEASETERPAMIAAAQQLAEALSAASGANWPIQLRLWDPGAAPAASAPGSVLITSLLCEVDRDEAHAQTQARWRARLGQLVTGVAPVLVCTVFRHVDERRTIEGARRLERIRRLNRMAPDLSRELGVWVIDIDRALAHVGASALATDYRLGGRLAAEVAGHTIAWALLSLGLDEVISPELQQRAKAFHGALGEIDRLVSRRLAAG